MDQLQQDYPWTLPPLISSAPMRLIALSALATQVSLSHGLGFIGAGSDVSQLDSLLTKSTTLLSQHSSHPLPTAHSNTLPLGVGLLVWAGDTLLHSVLPILARHRPAAVWLFAPREVGELGRWSAAIREATGHTSKIWVQVGTVAEAVEVVRVARPDVLVVQGQDAGGHGLERGAGLVPLVPEVSDAVGKLVEREEGLRMPVLVAAGGIMDGRGVAAAVALGAAGVTLGTRYLGAEEANLAKGYRDAVLKAGDGGVSTERGKLYDSLRGTTDWPAEYGGRGVLNESWYDAKKGLSFEENKKLYDAAVETGDKGWGDNARLTTYAGTGIGLVNKVESAAAITQSVRNDAKRILKEAQSRFA